MIGKRELIGIRCSNAGPCGIYANWVRQTGDKRENIIYKVSGKYRCVALVAIYGGDAEREIPKIKIDEELEKRIYCNELKCDKLISLNAEGTQ